jgi:hypothetical protein
MRYKKGGKMEVNMNEESGTQVAVMQGSKFAPAELSRDCFELKKIGGGAFGAVYEAINIYDPDRVVHALKEINKNHC